MLQTPIQVLHSWPGGSSKNEQKVHTCLIYNQDSTLSSWGSLCEDEDDPGKQRREFFKIFLDKQTLEAAHQQGISQAPESVSDAQRLVSDYLSQIYLHIKTTIQSPNRDKQFSLVGASRRFHIQRTDNMAEPGGRQHLQERD